MPTRAPLIGISSEFEEFLVAPGRDRSYAKLYHHYYHAIQRAGGRAVILPVSEKASAALDILPDLDGVMLTGSDDYPPGLYDEPAHPRTRLVPPWREAHDMTLARHLLQWPKPVLAICGGYELLNIAAGGSLIQDIESAGLDSYDHREGLHDVVIEAGTRLASILGERTRVNSWHHQAVSRVGKGLRAVARAPSGIIEALEPVDSSRFLIAVQWHPERLADESGSRAIFASFVAACAHREGVR